MDEPSLSQLDSQIPIVGMMFASVNELHEYYKAYALKTGFGICNLSSRNGEDGKPKWISIGCAKSGVFSSKGKNILQPRPSTKTNCKAKINFAVRNEGTVEITRVFLDHNHLLSPGKSRHLRCHKVLNPNAKRRLELNDEAGITLAKSFQSFVAEAGGYENLNFDERTCRNFISEARRLRLGSGDAEALSHHFGRMKNRCGNFFYAYDLDEESRLRNVFWADGRCRASYEYFSDVITFDTTYLTNRYDMPFAPFVGVNHHGQSILLGCGLLSSEDSESFTWLFNEWLTCMHGRAPKAIITDQCRSMAIAIEKVFPNTNHRYCLWHIMRKVPTKFGSHTHYKSIKKTLKNIVYNSITILECEENWMKMIEEYSLADNVWLKSLYIERSKWIPVYVKCHFWAGMSTSQRSESINAFFDDFVHSKTSLKQFVEQYDRALKRNIENEKKLDFQSFNSSIPIVSGLSLEKQFQNVYTNHIFKLFQSEVTGLILCNTFIVEDNGTTVIFGVKEIILGTRGEHLRDIIFKVHYTPDISNQFCVNCQCQMFEFRGILCRHIISVLTEMKVNNVPVTYIFDRWRKDVKRGYQNINNIYDSDVCASERNRYNYLTPMLQEVQYLAAKSEDKTSIVAEMLKGMKEQLMVDSTTSASTQITPTPSPSVTTEKLIHSPVGVRPRGRPPTKRKQSAIEKVKNKSTQEQRNDPFSTQLSFTSLLSSQLNPDVEDSACGDNIQRR